ncbi:GNAT family N-acetyltransferase [Clostridium folliculivorans]|uniref:N-acetyltransferase GCN5 n=1 Tax=Clostridium folliculivorans TaxID=2886038 RepID=A0A9W5Y229_9CLOT|nr:GNAT family N-acetyltransferase [Clostridium folliculivorans]GKU25166.1 N-acetyltransferase GCN5 [Clostridium folliculivorans]GKU31264.1 N-acetyltransferase GCN5 [Clostridium folliculivorans]
MNNNILIEEARKEEYDELREIFLKSRQENFKWMDYDSIKLEDFDSSTEGEIILTAKINDDIAGFVSIWEEDKFIHNLFVSSEFKGCGIGKALIKESIKAVGLPLTLKCVKENTNAFKFYSSQGWRVVEESKGAEPYYLMKYEG